jgi:hypothetical protein
MLTGKPRLTGLDALHTAVVFEHAMFSGTQ